jgi:SAM-dependent methyltransferase
LPRFGWTTLDEERINAILPHIRGRLLDIGAGQNRLVNQYGNGIGVDVIDWGGGAMVVEDSSQIPFPDKSFYTITFLACLNHIPYRERVIQEANRLLREEGRILITMINPILGGIGHALWWYSEDKKRGGMVVGEVPGPLKRDVLGLLETAGFGLQAHERFVYGLNNLYIFEQASRTI